MAQKKREDSVMVLLGVALSYMTYVAVMNQLPKPLADYNGHTYVYLSLFKWSSWVEGWTTTPYCMWHLSVLTLNRLLRVPLEISAAYVSIFFQLFSYFLTYWMIRRYTEAKAGCALGQGKAALIAFGLSLVQSLYLSWLDVGERFLGVFSMNAVHNPSQTCVRPFALLCFCLLCDIRGKQKDEAYCGVFFRVEDGLKKYYVCLTFALFLSVLAKPVFVEMFIPAVGLLMLAEWIGHIRRRDGIAGICFRRCLLMLLCALPSLLYILLWYAACSFTGAAFGAEGAFVVTKWMEVWGMYSENVILSIALGMAFPLYMVLIDGGFFVREEMGKVALAGYAVGILEAAVLGEGGNKLSHANFIWPMMCGMLLVWVTAVLRFLVLEEMQADAKRTRLLLIPAWFLFCLHVLCGMLYFKDVMY